MEFEVGVSLLFLQCSQLTALKMILLLLTKIFLYCLFSTLHCHACCLMTSQRQSLGALTSTLFRWAPYYLK